MGMYTEYNLRFELNKNSNVRDFFSDWFDDTKDDIRVPETEEFNHEFFECSRWKGLPFSGSFYFPQGSKSGMYVPWGKEGHFDIFIAGSIKNYDSEIGKFIDWVKPYVYSSGFMGYYLYEEDETPTLVYKD